MRVALLALLLLPLISPAMSAVADERPTVVVVVGAEGAPEYAAEFAKWADRWVSAANKGGARLVVVGRGADDTLADRDRLRQVLAAEAGDPSATQAATPATTRATATAGTTNPATTSATSPATSPATGPAASGQADATSPLWLILIGHGTYDGREAKLNLRGPDVTEQELADWLRPCRRPLAVLNCTSASAPFLNKLSGSNRVVVVATRSGQEQQYARFGDYLSAAIADPSADLDKDGQTSLLEAYLAAAARTEAFYKEAGRLATEHALLDDNGDALGTPSDWFQGTRAIKSARSGAPVDGHRAHQWHLIPSPAERAMSADARTRRDALELQIQSLRDRKSTLPEAEYCRQLEPLLLDLANLYAAEERRSSSN